MEVVVATRNKDKFKEISEILKNSKIKNISLNCFPEAPEVEEDGKTFKENAIKKAVVIARFTKRLTVADDSGLEVEALDGAPGVYSARFAGEKARYQDNNEKLLKLLKDIPLKKRKAKFVCCVAIADAKSIIGVVEGVCRGFIGEKPKGKNGFGYDPIFVVSKRNKTFAELSPEVKNKISHRSKAFAKAKKIIIRYIEEQNKV